MLAGLQGQEADEGDVVAGQGTDGVPGCVANVQPGAVTAHDEKGQGVERQQVGDEGISTPGCDHVAVEEGGSSTPEHRAELQCLDPEVEGENENKDGDGLVIVATGDRSGDVTRSNAHEDGGKETGGRRGSQLIGEEVRSKGCQTREGGGEKDTDVADIDGDRNGAQGVVDDAAGDHEAGVQGASGNPTERVPCAVIEPVPERFEAIGDQVFCRAEVEPGVDYTVSACRYSGRCEAGEAGVTNIRG